MREILTASPATGPFGPVIGHLDTAVRMVCAATLWLTFLAMLIPTFANAVLRYTTDASLIWSVEIVQLTFPWFIMAGAVLAAQHGRHIGVEFFLTLIPKHWARFVLIPVQLLVLMACAAVAYVYLGFGRFEGGIEFAAGDVMFTSLGVAQSWSYVALLIGYLLLGVTALTTIYRLLMGDVSPHQDEINSIS
jgi:TRAP-type C4-dicarboxylate transport system permease small subunit